MLGLQEVPIVRDITFADSIKDGMAVDCHAQNAHFVWLFASCSVLIRVVPTAFFHEYVKLQIFNSYEFDSLFCKVFHCVIHFLASHTIFQSN